MWKLAPFETKHPVLLPWNHGLTTFVVTKAHGHVHHNKVKETLTDTIGTDMSTHSICS